MKILHILDHSVPLHSGYTFRSRNIFAAQKNMGFDPVFLTSPKHEESLGEKCPEMEIEAEQVLCDRRFFILDEESFNAFEAALDMPLSENKAVQKLLAHKAPWDD